MRTDCTKIVFSVSAPGAAKAPVSLRPADVLDKPAGDIAVSPGLDLLRHGAMHVHLYAPRGIDPQGPHDQDELYFISRGQGLFRCGDQEVPFGAGDALFVPANTFHCFLDFSEDFEAWVVLWGAVGGAALAGEETAPQAGQRR